MRMLVVDDEADIANVLAEYFRMQGFDVTVANNGASALEAVSAGLARTARGAGAVDFGSCGAGVGSTSGTGVSASPDAAPAPNASFSDAAFDIILLDVNMPGMDGFELCRRIREHLSCPIIFLTARIEDVDQIDGFAAGADDYVLKPFSLEVLGRRVAAHMAREGRVRSRESAARFFRELTVDYGARTVEVCGERVDLTKLEFDIIALLSKRPGQVFDRDAIYERVWGWDAAGDPGQVREHIRRIRNKLAAASAGEDPIQTVWGVGYKWVAR